MNIDIRLKLDLFDHPKVRKLGLRLGSDAVLALIRLWLWAAANRADGVLRGMDAEDIELAAHWTGPQGRFVQTLCQLRLLDAPRSFLPEQGGSADESRAESSAGKARAVRPASSDESASARPDCFIVHDWAEHQAWASRSDERSSNARRAAQTRWSKAAGDKDESRQSRPRPAVPALSAPATPAPAAPAAATPGTPANSSAPAPAAPMARPEPAIPAIPAIPAAPAARVERSARADSAGPALSAPVTPGTPAAPAPSAPMARPEPAAPTNPAAPAARVERSARADSAGPALSAPVTPGTSGTPAVPAAPTNPAAPAAPFAKAQAAAQETAGNLQDSSLSSKGLCETMRAASKRNAPRTKNQEISSPTLLVPAQSSPVREGRAEPGAGATGQGGTAGRSFGNFRAASEAERVPEQAQVPAGSTPAAQPESRPVPSALRPDPLAGRPMRGLPPTLAEVEMYCALRGSGISARRFVEYYEARGWLYGGQPMRDWRAVLRLWEKRDRELLAAGGRSGAGRAEAGGTGQGAAPGAGRGTVRGPLSGEAPGQISGAGPAFSQGAGRGEALLPALSGRHPGALAGSPALVEAELVGAEPWPEAERQVFNQSNNTAGFGLSGARAATVHQRLSVERDMLARMILNDSRGLHARTRRDAAGAGPAFASLPPEWAERR